jgi:hypothetical protein
MAWALRPIVIAERTREREKRRQKLKKIDSSLLLICCCSRATRDFFHCVNLRSRLHTVTETIIRRPKETRVRLTKERTSIKQVFVMSSLFLSLVYNRSRRVVAPIHNDNGDRSSECMCVYMCARSQRILTE